MKRASPENGGVLWHVSKLLHGHDLGVRLQLRFATPAVVRSVSLPRVELEAAANAGRPILRRAGIADLENEGFSRRR